ncbi:MAG: sialate O-acetylesterase [Opitutaceae bacterium]|jgi:sialate O-acetylesterase
MNKLLIPVIILSLGASLRSDVVPAPLFTDNAVLQRDKPLPVWGMADAGEKVSVTFANQTLATTADATGKWHVTLATLPTRAEGTNLVIKGKNTITLTNVVVGEVWIASGQSNMEFTVKNTYDAAIDIPASVTCPLIRHIQIKTTIADAPVATAMIERATWEITSPKTTGAFSAVGYYFAKDLYQTLGVPVGIISSNVGGTPVESWIPSEAYQTVPDVAAKVKARWDAVLAEFPTKKAAYEAELAAWNREQSTARATGQPFAKNAPREPAGPGHKYTPSGLYNGMINPLVPYAIRGAIWYQGENNAGHADEYHALFSAMIES